MSVLLEEGKREMREERLRVSRRNLPHWALEGAAYFVTFRVESGELSPAERTIFIEHLKSGEGRFYLLAAAVVMPDHVHLILRPNEEFSLSDVMQGVKGVSARLINEARGRRGQFWQDESHDRILRNEAEFIEKLQYMADNPAKAGLIERGEPYEWWMVGSEFSW